MNKRIKKKRLLTELLRANNLQQEVIEDYGRQLAVIKCELADLQAIVGRNALADNNRFDQLEAENKALQDEIAELKRQMKSKKSWLGRK